MITEQQLKNFKGMKTYGELKEIKRQLSDIFNRLYDMGIDKTDAAAMAVIRAGIIVNSLMEDN